LAPLLEDLYKLWKDGVRIFDAYLKEYFILRAIIFFTINDFLAYGNLSGHRTKGAKACPIYGEDTHTI
jgi:Transposase family tnp2